MSRVGKQPVVIPSGVKASINGAQVSIEGPKGKLSHTVPGGISVATADGKLNVTASGTDRQTRANFGTTRAHLNNMVQGVTKGWKRSLELSGVGFNAKVQGNILVLAVGYSHEVKILLPETIKCTVSKTTIELESPNKELLGTLAAGIRKVRPPEPYLGKGIKFSEETIRRKAGKTGKK